MKRFTQILIALFIVTNIVNGQKQLFPQMPGMVSYTYRNGLKQNAEASLDTIQSLGIRDMEFSNLFGKTAVELKKLLDARGIHCSSFGVSYPDAITKTKEVAENAIALGASFVRVAWIPHTGDFTIKDAQKAVEDFNRIGKELKEVYGLSFCYHNHGYEFSNYENGTLYDYIVQHTDPKYVHFELDILWAAFPGQDPVAILHKYGSRIKLMHLKDLRKGVTGNLSGGTSVENDVALGTGQIDIPAVLTAAKKAKLLHYYIEDESPSFATQVPQTISYLKGLKK